MKNSRADPLHSVVMEPKALAMVVSAGMVIVLLIGQTLMDLAVMVATTTLLHLQLPEEY